MTAAAAPLVDLPPEELEKLLALLKQADSVELKLTVSEPHQRSAVVGLELDPLDAELRQVFFFDTPELTLNTQGLVVRARRSQGKGDDSVVKLRPVVPAELPKSVRRSSAFSVEVDASPAGYVCSGSLKGVPGKGDVRDVAAGRKKIRKLFSKEQRALYEAHAPEGLGLDDLAVLGPILVLKLKRTPKGFGRPLVAEVWAYPDGSRILELSTKCEPDEAFEVAAEARAYLSARGVELHDEQETKTRTALEFFAEHLAGD
jgi:hypothetical protein